MAQETATTSLADKLTLKDRIDEAQRVLDTLYGKEIDAVKVVKISIGTRIEEARAAIEQLQRQMNQEIEVVRNRMRTKRGSVSALLGKLFAEFRGGEAGGEAVSPGFQEMLEHDSYEQDDAFTPSEIDTARKEAFEYRIYKAQNETANLEARRNYLNRLPGNIEELKNEIQRISNMNVFKRLWNRDDRPRLRQSIAGCQKELKTAPKDIAEVELKLARLQEHLAGLPPQRAYDDSVHSLPALSFFPRDKQAILVTYNPRGEMLTLHMPFSRADKDFTQTLSLKFLNSPRLEEFTALLGDNIDVGNAGFNLRESLTYDQAFEEQLIPFALETTIIDGKERFRIPQAVWEQWPECDAYAL